MSNINIFNCSTNSFHPPSQKIIVEPFELANPCVSYYLQDQFTIPSYFTNFVYLMNRADQCSIPYSNRTPQSKFSACGVSDVSLHLLGNNCKLRIFDCTIDRFNLDDLQRYIIGDFSDRKCHCEFAPYNHIWYKHFPSQAFYPHGDLWFFENKNQDFPYSPQEDVFKCFHATSGSVLKGIGASIYSSYQFYTAGSNFNQETMTKVLTRWGLELVQLGLNFTPLNLIFSFLKLLNEWFDITQLVESAVSLFTNTLSFLNRKSKQPTSGYSQYAATSLVIDLSTISSIQDSTPALASALASIFVIFGVLIVGKDVCSNSRYDTLSQKMAEVMSCMTKFRSGIAAIKDMLASFSKFMYEIIFDLLGLESDSELLKLIREVEVIESDFCEKEKVFEYCKFLTDPANLLLIQSNEAYRRQLEFSHTVIESVRFKIASQVTSISANMISYLSTTLIELQKVRKAIAKTSVGESSRFCPFWLNIVGSSHTGKSSFTSIFVKYFVLSLERIGKDENIDFEIPSQSNRYYSVNFSDKFETNYTGQYITMIDDFAQDGPGAVETSSALKMINWVSNIPYYTNQAQIDNKGIPFTSKVIVSTSNDFSLANRKEVISVDALINRMSLCFKFEPTEDPFYSSEWFPRPVKIYEWDFKRNCAVSKKPITPVEAITISVMKYKAWFLKEKKLEKLRQIDPEISKEIMAEINHELEVEKFEAAKRSGVPPTPNTVSSVSKLSVGKTQPKQTELKSVTEVRKATSGYSNWLWCKFMFNPGYTEDGLFNCTCKGHQYRNELYTKARAGGLDISMKEFVELSALRETGLQILGDELRTKWGLVKNKVAEYCKKPLFLLIAGAVSLMLAGTWALKLTQATEDSEEQESLSSDATVKYSIGVKRAKNQRAVIKNQVTATSGFDHVATMFNSEFCTNAIEIARDVIIARGLVVRLSVIDDSGNVVREWFNTGLRLHETSILTNHHFMKNIREGEKLKISYSDREGKVHAIYQTFTSTRMKRIEETDLVIYKCDNALPIGKSLLKHFPETLVKVHQVNSLVITADPIPTVYTNIVAKPCLHKVEYEVEGELYQMLDSWETNCPVRYGMSGSILFSMSSMDKHKIIGIQVCKNTRMNDHGFFKPVSQEQLKSALAALNVSNIERDEIRAGTCYKSDGLCPGNLNGNSLTYLGSVPKAKQVLSQTQTKIIPSMIQDPCTLTQEPSVLSDYDERMKESIRKKPIIFRAIEGFDHEIGSIDNKVLDQAVDQLKVEYDVLLDLPNIERRVLNDFEMINGVPSLLLPIDMKTSPGYPYVLERKVTTCGGKYEWFEELETIPAGYGKAYQMKQSLLSGVEQAESKLRNGILPEFISYCCLKDETRPIQKIVDGKTRAFICMPLHYNLLIRKYFGAFIAAQKKQAVKISSCVGVDPANDWIHIYNKLMAKNKRWEDFDYANWDQYLHPELIMRVADIVNYWYKANEVDARVRKLLLYNLIYTYIIVKDRMFLKSQGQCSGCAITAELNCLVHDLLMVYVWIKLHQDQGLTTSLNEMRESVALCVYGDDIIMAVDPSCDIEFNGTTIAPIMSSLGMNITPGDKISTTFEVKDPIDVYFLKRNFVKDGEKVLAPLRSDIVENIIQWIHKSDDKIEATRVNCITALQESYMHRRAYFDKLSNVINERIKLYNRNNPGNDFKPICLDYNEFDRKYQSGKYVCAGLPGLQTELLE